MKPSRGHHCWQTHLSRWLVLHCSSLNWFLYLLLASTRRRDCSLHSLLDSHILIWAFRLRADQQTGMQLFDLRAHIDPDNGFTHGLALPTISPLVHVAEPRYPHSRHPDSLPHPTLPNPVSRDQHFQIQSPTINASYSQTHHKALSFGPKTASYNTKPITPHGTINAYKPISLNDRFLIRLWQSDISSRMDLRINFLPTLETRLRSLDSCA